MRGILPLALGMSLLWPAGIARAAVSCSFDAGTGTVSITAAHGDIPTLSRVGDAIAVDGVACGTATVTTTDSIDFPFPDDFDADTIVIDLAGGPLAPGATDEGDGSSEIEIDVTLGDGSFDTLRIVGTPGPDAFEATGSVLGVNLNAGETVADDDVTVNDQISLELIGGDGDDDLVADNFSYFARGTLLGGGGDDRLSPRFSEPEDVYDGGPGWDVADFSWMNEVHIVWDESGTVRFSGREIANVEVAILTDGGDSVVYEGDAIGETWLGDSFDTVEVRDHSPLVNPADRVVHGGPGAFDSIEFELSLSSFGAGVELSPDTLGGTWPATYDDFEFIRGSSRDDQFLVDHQDVYPTIVGRGGNDRIDLRWGSVEGINVTLGQDTFGTELWLRAFEFEQIFGTAYRDFLLGPRPGQEGAVYFWGSGGNDYMRGGDKADVMRGGRGADKLLGQGRADTLLGSYGNDWLSGGDGYDELRGGPGADVLIGGRGADACVGGGPSDQVDCER